jgi:hypothetical protein
VSLAQGLNSVLPSPRAQRFHGFERVREGGRRHLENSMVSVLWVFNQSFHVVKYLSRVVTV